MNEEHQAIATKIALMEQSMNSNFAAVGKAIRGMREDVSEIKNTLQGDHTNPGLTIRVDRLEQSEKRQGALHKVWGVGFFGIIIKFLESKLGL